MIAIMDCQYDIRVKRQGQVAVILWRIFIIDTMFD